MMNDVNEAIKRNNHNAKPFKVEGYPSVMLVGQDGNEITAIEPVKDTAAMTKVMNESVGLANEAGLIRNTSSMEMKASIRPNNARTTPPKIASLKASATPDFIDDDMGESEGVSLAPNRTRNNSRNSARNNANSKSASNIAASASKKLLEENAAQQASLYTPSMNAPSLAMPPAANQDHDMENGNGSMQKGGSLYTAMSQSAYTLAAPAALLATAALMMRRNTRKYHKGKRSSHKGKRSSHKGKRSSRHGKKHSHRV